MTEFTSFSALLGGVLIGLAAVLLMALFGLGLAISQMINPLKVLGFLDVLGNWDPSLAFVMVGTIAVTLPGFLPGPQNGQARLRSRPPVAGGPGHQLPVVARRGPVRDRLGTGRLLPGTGYWRDGIEYPRDGVLRAADIHGLDASGLSCVAHTRPENPSGH